MFEKASRLKLRFNYKGQCTTEDLWIIPLQALDLIYKEINQALKAQKEDSLLETKSKDDQILDLKIEIVKHVVKVRLQEQKDRADAISRSEKKQKIMSIIADKQDAKLQDMSIDKLSKLVEEL